MPEQTIALLGSSAGSTTNETYPLSSEWHDSTADPLEIPEGMEADLVLESLDAESETRAWLEVSEDGGSTWREEGQALKLASAGHVDGADRSEPVTVSGRIGPQTDSDRIRVRFRFIQASAAWTRLSVTANITAPDGLRGG